MIITNENTYHLDLDYLPQVIARIRFVQVYTKRITKNNVDFVEAV